LYNFFYSRFHSIVSRRFDPFPVKTAEDPLNKRIAALHRRENPFNGHLCHPVVASNALSKLLAQEFRYWIEALQFSQATAPP